MSLFQSAPGEKVLFRCNGMWFKRKLMAFPGELHITDQRVVFEKWDNPGSSPLARLIMKSQRAAILFDVPLPSITAVKFKRKKALLKEIGRITVEHNGEVFTIQPDDFENVVPLLPHVVEEPWN